MNTANIDIIDTHSHLGSFFQFPIRWNSTVEIADLAKSLGIKKMCISHLLGLSYDAETGNSLTLKAVNEQKDLFLFGGVIDPRWGEERIVSEYRRINSHVSMWNEMHPALHHYSISGHGYRVALELIKANPKPVLFHTDQSDQYSKPGLIEDLVKLYPDIPFIIGHSGNVIGGFEIAVKIASKYENVYLDSAFSRNYMGLMKWIIEKIGADKILFGSDIPFLNGAAQVGKLYESDISEADREKIFHENAAKLLHLS